MDKIEVGKRIKTFMKDRGLTQNDVADAFGISQSNVSEMTSGKKNTLKLAELMSDTYDVSLDWLIYGDNISKRDINITDGDSTNTTNKYAERVLELFKEYIENEHRYQDIISRNQEILKQMVALEKLMKGE